MRNNQINIFEIISRINDDFGNHVYIARSFPSVDVQIMGTTDVSHVKIKTYDSDNSECPVGILNITWNKKDSRPVYHVFGNSEQTTDGETTSYDTFDWTTKKLVDVIRQILATIDTDDEPNGDDDTENWESGMTPYEYWEMCVRERKGILKGINSKTVLSTPWN